MNPQALKMFNKLAWLTLGFLILTLIQHSRFFSLGVITPNLMLACIVSVFARTRSFFLVFSLVLLGSLFSYIFFPFSVTAVVTPLILVVAFLFLYPLLSGTRAIDGAIIAFVASFISSFITSLFVGDFMVMLGLGEATATAFTAVIFVLLPSWLGSISFFRNI